MITVKYYTIVNFRCVPKVTVTRKSVHCAKRYSKCVKGNSITVFNVLRGCVCRPKTFKKRGCKCCIDRLPKWQCEKYRAQGYCETDSWIRNKVCTKTCVHQCCRCKPRKPVGRDPGTHIDYYCELSRRLSLLKDVRKYFIVNKKDLRTGSESECRRVCDMEPRCRSFDFSLSKKRCILLSIVKEEIQKRGLRYSAKLSKDRKYVSCRRQCRESK